MTHTLTTIATIVVGALVVVAFILGKIAFGRLAPTLAVLAIGVPSAYGLGSATGIVVNQTSDPRWLYASVGGLILALVAFAIGAGIRAAIHDTPHQCEPGSGGRCVDCAQPVQTTTAAGQKRGVSP
jgi:hypothetical protein